MPPINSVAFFLIKYNNMEIKIEQLVWKKRNGERIPDINNYVLNYVKNVDKGAKVLILFA